MDDGWSYGINVCVPLKSVCQNLIPRAMVLGEGAFGGDSVMRVEPS